MTKTSPSPPALPPVMITQLDDWVRVFIDDEEVCASESLSLGDVYDLLARLGVSVRRLDAGALSDIEDRVSEDDTYRLGCEMTPREIDEWSQATGVDLRMVCANTPAET